MTRLAFGGFELDPHTGELWKGEDCVRIQDQPLKLLLCLLERPGQIIGREELQKRVWAGDIHVDFEDGLNAAAWRLRQALGDSAESPRFIETIPRKGYRFTGKVVPLPGKPPPASGSFPMPVFRPVSGFGTEALARGRQRRHPWKWWLGAGLGLGLLGGGMVLSGGLKARTVTLLVTPLSNVTGDPAVDYFASALSRQVAQDLARSPRLEVQPPETWTRAEGATPKAALTLTWSLGRTAQNYHIMVSLADAQGLSRGDRAFTVSPEALHQVHWIIADHVIQQATGEAAPSGSIPQTDAEVSPGGSAVRAGGGS